MNVWHIIAAFFMAFWSGAVVATGSGFLFAYMVFVTKREPHERMIGGPGKGGAYTSDPLNDRTFTADELINPPPPAKIPPGVEAINARFREMMEHDKVEPVGNPKYEA